MTLIVKAEPVPLAEGEETEFLVRSYKDVYFLPGLQVYIWFSQTQGGDGLAARAHLIDAANELGGMRLRLHVGRICVGPGMRNADLRPHRDNPNDAVRHMLSQRLYSFAHNKAGEITDAEAQLLESHL